MNFENIYWVTIPEVLQAYTTQMNRCWGIQAPGDEQVPPTATPPQKMPDRDE